MRKMIIGLAAICAIMPVAAHAMSVAEFLAKTDALKAQGVLAMASPDIGLLRSDIAKASDAYRAGLAAEVAAGRKPSSCPPPKGTAKVTSDDIIAAFRAIPAGQRTGMSTKVAFAAFMTKRYPCKA
ncbi:MULTISPECIES: hypothetical protein [unclassified Sphingomonas]|uniref:hypothetical protein n=1 Tax=unclassified Sphingomonas TaxID=196159 RepID=UPI000BDCB619|nr:MAG: hypothetical protein B7Z43_02970 [Sphingomonas sp. 12-62-6]OYX39282.1 MAG: hypothetical protein B7Y98_04900 [Sphingomonas sp. 32-62-10]